MSLISNIKINNDLLSFDLNNNSKEFKISFVNAIRRTIIADVYTYAIDNDSIIFYENTSMLNDEFLKHRLTLIPIISNISNFNYDDIIISCKKINDGENIESVYVNNFICMDSKNNIIDNSILFKYPNILFAKLKNNQNISFECKIKKNNAYYGGAFYSPVSICLYTFNTDKDKIDEITKDMNENEKKTFFTQDVQRIYKKNELGEPFSYHFELESIGFYSVMEILLFGINSLKDRLMNIKTELRNTKSKKINILNNDENPDFFEFLLDHENETIGNLLSTYITYDPNVFYCGYVIEHPLKNNIILKIKLKSDNNLDNNIKIIENMIIYLVNILNKISNELTSIK
jgi:DNA-directed RNA polymerase II subunit RPB3